MKGFIQSYCIIMLIFLISNKAYSQSEIQINKVNGIFKIPCKINGVPMDFIFDTGASDVSISITEAMFLYKQGLLNNSDIIGEKKYRIANGTIETGNIINLKEVQVEGIILKNVKATVVNTIQAPLLLGMNAISKLGKVELSENKLTIIKGVNDIAKSKKENDWEAFYEKATNGIFRMFQTVGNNKVDDYIKRHIDLFEAPLSLDGSTSVFNKANKDSSTISAGIKDFFKYFFKNTKGKNIKWKELSFNDFRFKTDGSDIITTINYNDTFYIFKTWFYWSMKKKYVINFEPVLVTLNAYEYNAQLHGYFEEFENKKISETEYIMKQVEYAERAFPYLNKKDLMDVRMGNALDEIYNYAAYHFYKRGLDYIKSMYYCNKVIQIKKSNFIDASYFLRGKCKLQLKDYRGAITDFDKYLSLDPKVAFKWVYLLRGDAKYELNDVKSALLDYTKSTLLNPDDPESFYKVGSIKFNDLSDKKGGCAAWSKAGELGSTNAYKLIKEFCN